MTVRLARESAANKVNWSGHVDGREGSHVGVDGDSGPMLSQDCLAVGVDLTEGDGLDSGPLAGKREPSDSRKEVKTPQ